MANAFEDVRRASSRVPLGAALSLWILGIASGWFVGIAVGIALVFAVGLPLSLLGADVLAGTLLLLGWALTVLWAVTAPILGASYADRLAVWATGAVDAEHETPEDRELRQRAAVIAIAAGVEPSVFVVDATFIDAAGVGFRRNRGDARPVVLITRAAASLPEPTFRALVASALSDATAGRGSAIARSMAVTAALVPAVFVRRGWRALRGKRIRALAGVVIVLYTWGCIAALTATDNSNTNAVVRALATPLFATIFAFLFAIIISIASIVALAWLGVLAAPASWFAARARESSDIAAISLTRDPKPWAQLIAGAPQRASRPGWLDRATLGWTLPVNATEARRRLQTCEARVPGVANALE